MVRSGYLGLLALAALGCACKADKVVADAGTPIERGTDLRSAINTVFPEYRGTNLMAGRARLTRTLAPATGAELEKAQAAALKNGFEGDPPARKPFVLEQALDGGVLVQELAIGLTPDELGRIVAAPSAMSTEAMANWVPKTSAPKVREHFELELIWLAKDVSRAEFLVWQLVDGALATGWTAVLPPGFSRRRPDGGAGEVPVECTITLNNPPLGARIDIERKADRTLLRYGLTTFERR